MTKNSRAANACKISVLLLFSSILLGCNFAPSYQQPQDVVAATVPDATPAPALAPAVLAAAQADALQWLADDRLRHTVALALHNNRDLRIAADNVAKARAQYGIARADQLPSITAQLQGQRSRSSADVSNSTRLVNEQVSASIGFASYEVDLWGRIRNLNAAAWQQFLQVQENRRGVEIALIAEVANAWLTLAADQERLALAQELKQSSLPQAAGWYQTLEPLTQDIRDRLVDYLGKLTYPIRVGTHYNTAFALALGLDYARAVEDSALEQAIVTAAERFYLADTRYPAHYEPGGDEYISGALTEALLMSKVAEDFPAWFDAFLPEVGAVAALMSPAQVSDRTDPKIAHLDGLNLSRAWCMKHIAKALPANHPAQQALRDSVAKHLMASVEHVVGSHYSGGHWLASFALLALE